MNSIEIDISSSSAQGPTTFPAIMDCRGQVTWVTGQPPQPAHRRSVHVFCSLKPRKRYHQIKNSWLDELTIILFLFIRTKMKGSCMIDSEKTCVMKTNRRIMDSLRLRTWEQAAAFESRQRAVLCRDYPELLLSWLGVVSNQCFLFVSKILVSICGKAEI